MKVGREIYSPTLNVQCPHIIFKGYLEYPEHAGQGSRWQESIVLYKTHLPSYIMQYLLQALFWWRSNE